MEYYLILGPLRNLCPADAAGTRAGGYPLPNLPCTQRSDQFGLCLRSAGGRPGPDPGVDRNSQGFIGPCSDIFIPAGHVSGGEYVIYLDCAATTFQKPPAVAAAMERAMATMSSPGRGGYQAAMEAADTAFTCRSELAEMFHVENPGARGIYYECNSRVEYRHQKPVPPGGRAVILRL